MCILVFVTKRRASPHRLSCSKATKTTKNSVVLVVKNDIKNIVDLLARFLRYLFNSYVS